jgi:hypothetical protein
MSTIAISDLRPTGSDLFIDSENYLRELSESEMIINNGGTSPVVIPVTLVIGSGVVIASAVASIAYSIARVING